MNDRAMEKRREDLSYFRDSLMRMEDKLREALPKEITPQRMARLAMTALQKTPKLLNCTKPSVFGAIMTAAQLGLEPDGLLGQGYLVPYGSECKFIPGYKGYIDLAHRSGQVVEYYAHAVREGDTFEWCLGLDRTLIHRPASDWNPDPTGDDISHTYSVVKYRGGGHDFTVMTREEIEQIREGSQGYQYQKRKGGTDTPWIKHFPPMAEKSAIRRLANRIPLSVVRIAAEVERIVEAGGRYSIERDGKDLYIDAEIIPHEEEEEEEERRDPLDETMDNLAGDGPEDGGGR